jgi:TetR/AcrR family transcriptional regulator
MPGSLRVGDVGLMDVREHILTEATRLFSAQGFDGTSLKEIADRVGIRKPSLLYHFHSKDDLRRAVLEQMLHHWNEVLPRLLMAAASGRDQFAGVVDEMVAFFAADPDRARLLVRELLDRPDDVADLIKVYVRPWAELAADFIRKGQEQEQLHGEVDPEAYVVQLISLVVAGVATSDCFSALFDPDADQGEIRRRNTLELRRVAKFSLFKR